MGRENLANINPPQERELSFEKIEINKEWLDSAIRDYLFKNRDFLKMLPKGVKKDSEKGYTADRIERMIDGVSKMFGVSPERIEEFVQKNNYQIFSAILRQNSSLLSEDRVGFRFKSANKKW